MQTHKKLFTSNSRNTLAVAAKYQKHKVSKFDQPRLSKDKSSKAFGTCISPKNQSSINLGQQTPQDKLKIQEKTNQIH